MMFVIVNVTRQMRIFISGTTVTPECIGKGIIFFSFWLQQRIFYIRKNARVKRDEKFQSRMAITIMMLNITSDMCKNKLWFRWDIDLFLLSTFTTATALIIRFIYQLINQINTSWGWYPTGSYQLVCFKYNIYITYFLYDNQPHYENYSSVEN